MISQNNKRKHIKKYVFSGTLLEEYLAYTRYLEELEITKDTMKWRLKHIRGFLDYLDKHNIVINNILPNVVYDYMMSIDDLSVRTKEHRAVCIRLFLNWLFNNKKIETSGTHILPKIKNNKQDKVAAYYSNEEVSKILNSINIHDVNGKRDLAIMLLFVRFGLRERDVQQLKLENIKWNDNKIIIVQSKNKQINTYPMTTEIRYALIDYLKNERPISNLPYLFLTDSKNICTSHFFYKLVNKYFRKAEINTSYKKHGSHSLRHSLATSLLNDGNSLYTISSILGHKYIADSQVYTKVDIENLKKIPLEVPLWKA